MPVPGPEKPVKEEASATGAHWEIPTDLRTKAEAFSIRYDNPPAWDGGKHCTGKFTPGARALADFLKKQFPAVKKVEGYSCRPNTANKQQTSVHGTGRAIDIYCTGAEGDQVANWLVENANQIGVQYVIWRRTFWNGSKKGRKDGDYTGPDPHTDHIHCELNTDGGEAKTPWFSWRTK